MEHSSPSIETVADMAVLGRALGFPVVVRPPGANREWITRLLDVGVMGLHIPQVDNPEIARDGRGGGALRAARDARAVGRRAAQRLHAGHRLRRRMNEQVHITVMFESAEAFRHLDEIVGMEGIDAVTLGPSDLAQELGVIGTPDQARVIDEHRDRLIEAAKRHGKDVAMLCQTLEEAERWIAAGVKIIAYSTEVSIIRQGYASAVQRLTQSRMRCAERGICRAEMTIRAWPPKFRVPRSVVIRVIS